MSARAFVAAALGVAALYLLHVAWLSGVAEDAFISFRYARNLAAGLGFVWNPGELPVEGYTNFLWVAVLSVAAWLELDVPRVAQALGVASALLILAYTVLVMRSFGWKREWSLLPMGLLACAGPFAAWASAGLETLAFTLFAFGALYHATEWCRDGNGGDQIALLLMLLLAALTRPEGVLVGAVLVAIALVYAPRAGRRRLLRGVAVLVLAYAAYFAWRWQLFGYPLPNTFYAKTGGGVAQLERGAAYLGWFAVHYLLPWLPTVAVAALGSRVWMGLGAPTPVVAAAASFVLVWAGYVVAVGGDYMAMYRFFVPMLPPLALLLAIVLRSLLRSCMHAGAFTRVSAGAALAIGLVGTLMHSTPFEAWVYDVPPRMHGNYRGVETERWHVARLTRLAEVFAARAESANESIATDAIGALAWHSGLRVHGAHGLVDPAVAHQSGAFHAIGQDYAGHDRRDLWRLFEKRPTWFMFTRELRTTRPSGIEVPDAYAERVREGYRLESVWVEDPRNGEAGWFPFLELRAATPEG